MEVGLFAPFCLCVGRLCCMCASCALISKPWKLGRRSASINLSRPTHVVLWNAYEKKLSPRRIIELSFLSPLQVANELGLKVEGQALQRGSIPSTAR